MDLPSPEDDSTTTSSIISFEASEYDEDIIIKYLDREVYGWKRCLHLPFEPIWSYSVLICGTFQILTSIYDAGFRRLGKDYFVESDFSGT